MSARITASAPAVSAFATAGAEVLPPARGRCSIATSTFVPRPWAKPTASASSGREVERKVAGIRFVVDRNGQVVPGLGGTQGGWECLPGRPVPSCGCSDPVQMRSGRALRPCQHPAQAMRLGPESAASSSDQVQFGVVDRIAEREDCGRVAFDRDIPREEQRVHRHRPSSMAECRRVPAARDLSPAAGCADGQSSSRSADARSRATGRSTGSIRNRRDAWSSRRRSIVSGCGRHKAPRRAGQHQIQGQQRGGDEPPDQ